MSKKAHKIFKIGYLCTSALLYLAFVAIWFLAPYVSYITSEGGDVQLGYAIYFLLFSLIILPYFPCLFAMLTFIRTLVERIGKVRYNGAIGIIIVVLRGLAAAVGVAVTGYYIAMASGLDLDNNMEQIMQDTAMLFCPLTIIVLSVLAFILHCILRIINKKKAQELS